MLSRHKRCKTKILYHESNAVKTSSDFIVNYLQKNNLNIEFEILPKENYQDAIKKSLEKTSSEIFYRENRDNEYLKLEQLVNQLELDLIKKLNKLKLSPEEVKQEDIKESKAYIAVQKIKEILDNYRKNYKERVEHCLQFIEKKGQLLLETNPGFIENFCTWLSTLFSKFTSNHSISRADEIKMRNYVQSLKNSLERSHQAKLSEHTMSGLNSIFSLFYKENDHLKDSHITKNQETISDQETTMQTSR